MRIEVSDKVFKRSMERVMAVIMKGAPLAYMDYIKMSATPNGVKLEAVGHRDAVMIDMNASVIECGSAYVHKGDVKKISNLSGYLTIATSNEILTVRNEKKRSAISTRNFDDKEFFHDGGSDKIELFKVSSEKLLDMLEITNPARDGVDSNRPVLTGFHISSKYNRMITLDGYRMHAVRLDIDDSSGNFCHYNITINGDIYPHLNKILKGRPATVLTAYDCEHNTLRIVGSDFEYYVGYLDGDYPDAYGTLKGKDGKDYSYKVDAGEIGAIAKEYMRQSHGIRDNSDNLIYLMGNGDGLSAAMSTTDYQTTDKIESACDMAGCMDGNMIALNPKYVSDGMDAFKNYGGLVSVYGGYRLSNESNACPMSVETEDVLVLILPVINSNVERVRNVRNFICAA